MAQGSRNNMCSELPGNKSRTAVIPNARRFCDDSQVRPRRCSHTGLAGSTQKDPSPRRWASMTNFGLRHVPALGGAGFAGEQRPGHLARAERPPPS